MNFRMEGKKKKRDWRRHAQGRDSHSPSFFSKKRKRKKKKGKEVKSIYLCRERGRKTGGKEEEGKKGPCSNLVSFSRKKEGGGKNEKLLHSLRDREEGTKEVSTRGRRRPPVSQFSERKERGAILLARKRGGLPLARRGEKVRGGGAELFVVGKKGKDGGGERHFLCSKKKKGKKKIP